MYLPDEAPENQVQLLDLGRQALEEAKSAGTSRGAGACPRAVRLRAGKCRRLRQRGRIRAHRSRHLPRAMADRRYARRGLGSRSPSHSSHRTEPASSTSKTASCARPRPETSSRCRSAASPRNARKSISSRSSNRTDVPTYDEELFIPPPEATPVDEGNRRWSFGPGPQQGAWKEVVVSISAETMWAYEDGELVMSSLVSTGTAETPETTTPSRIPLRACQV